MSVRHRGKDSHLSMIYIHCLHLQGTLSYSLRPALEAELRLYCVYLRKSHRTRPQESRLVAANKLLGSRGYRRSPSQAHPSQRTFRLWLLIMLSRPFRPLLL